MYTLIFFQSALSGLQIQSTLKKKLKVIKVVSNLTHFEKLFQSTLGCFQI